MARILGTKAMDFLVAGITIGTGLLVIQGFMNNITDTNSLAYQGLQKVANAINVFPDWMPTIALVIVAAVVIAYVTGFGKSANE